MTLTNLYVDVFKHHFQCSDYTTPTSSSSAGPSWKRSWSSATSIPSMVRTVGALSPTRANLLPPHKRYMGTSATHSSESSDEGIKPVLLGVETGFEPGLAVVVSESESEEAEADDKADAEVQSEGTIEIEVDIATGIDIPDDLLMPDAIERLGIDDIESRQREQEGRNLTAEGERYGLLGCVVALEGSNTRLQDALDDNDNRSGGNGNHGNNNGDGNQNGGNGGARRDAPVARQCSDYTTLTSYSSVGPSWKRSWSLATSIPSMVRTAGALSPTQTDLLPPHKRYRGTSAMYSSESSDEGSLETHIELNIDTDIQAYIETTIATVDGLGIKPVIAGLKTGFELGLAVVESESEPKEAEADDKADAKVQIEGTIEIGVDVATGIDIPDDLLVPDAIDRLGQLEEENGNSWVPNPVTTPSETGTSTTTKMTMPSTTEEKTYKKNDVKARSLLLMALPNEHQLTFGQYVDAQSMFTAIKARFGGNEATKKTQKALLKQQYENFSASSLELLDSIFNRLQRLVSRLAILGVVTPLEDLNVKFLRSLPSEWDIHVVVWMNKPDFDTIGLDDLYNNFKIVEQKVKKSVGASNDDKNLAFLTTSGASSTNNNLFTHIKTIGVHVVVSMVVFVLKMMKEQQLLVLSDIGYYMFLVLGCEEDIGIKHIFVLGDQEISACALRNFDLEVMEWENTQNNALAKLPMLKLGEHQPKVVQSTTTKMTVPVLTIEEKDYVNRNDVKASEVYSS
ncbi:hypothetical protein Tco_0996407 [Tanacetum coccineum]